MECAQDAPSAEALLHSSLWRSDDNDDGETMVMRFSEEEEEEDARIEVKLCSLKKSGRMVARKGRREGTEPVVMMRPTSAQDQLK